MPGPQQMVGGDIAIEKILGAEAVNEVVQNQKAAERRNQFSFEMKLELLTVQAQDSANDMQSKSVQLCLCANFVFLTMHICYYAYLLNNECRVHMFKTHCKSTQ